MHNQKKDSHKKNTKKGNALKKDIVWPLFNADRNLKITRQKNTKKGNAIKKDIVWPLFNADRNLKTQL